MKTYTEHDRMRERAFICWTEGSTHDEENPATVTAKSPQGNYYTWTYEPCLHAFLADFNEEDAPSELQGLSIAAEIREHLTVGDLYGTRLFIDEDGEIQDVTIY